MAELSEGLDLSDSDTTTREISGIVSTGFESLSAARAAAAGLLGDRA